MSKWLIAPGPTCFPPQAAREDGGSGSNDMLPSPSIDTKAMSSNATANTRALTTVGFALGGKAACE